MKFSGKWTSDKGNYKDTCVRLSKNLTGFKRDHEYIYYVGNDVRPPRVVEAFDKVVESNYVHENDRIGSPTLHNGKSAGTLRFMKVVEDIKIGYESVIEIGGGYGGQCLVMKKMRNVDYTIIDIPEALELSKAYLNENSIDCDFVSSEDFKPLKCDLLISDYCLSELNEKGIDFYLDNIDFNIGYFTLNGMTSYIKEKLSNMGYQLRVSAEHPKTSHHNNTLILAHK